MSNLRAKEAAEALAQVKFYAFQVAKHTQFQQMTNVIFAHVQGFRASAAIDIKWSAACYEGDFQTPDFL